MKTNIKQYVYLLLALLGFACSDLAEDPKPFFVDDQFMKNAKDARGALTGAYSILRSSGLYGQDIYYISDMMSDQISTTFGSADLDDFVFTSENARIENVWNACYIGINRANYLIARTPDINANDEEKSQIIAEAKFLRALHYFNLARMWGDVPLRLAPLSSVEDVSIPKSPVDKVFDQIILDLVEAEADLVDEPINGSEARATTWAVKSLLAKVYLYAERYNLASEKSKEVIDQGPYSLFESFSEVWRVQNENRDEHIYSVQTNLENGSGLQTWFTPRGTDYPGSPRGWFHLSMDMEFFMDFDSEDDRFTFLDTAYVNTKGDTIVTSPFPYNKKYIEVGEATITQSRHNVNYPVLRYSDILLIYAEASARTASNPTQASYDAINAVRDRAYGDQDHRLPDGLSLEQFIDAVILERNYELFAEGDRYWDLARTGKYLTAFPGLPVEAKHKYLPIPETEIISSGGIIEQNPLWK